MATNDIILELEEMEKKGLLQLKQKDSENDSEQNTILDKTNDSFDTLSEEDVLQEDIYRLITENTNDLICITTFSLRPSYIYVNPSYRKILECEKAELIGRNSFDFIHPDDKKKLRPLIKKHISLMAKNKISGNKQKISEEFDCRLIDKSGNYHYIEHTANLIGKMIVFIGRDVTERRQAENELKRSEEKLSVIFNSSTDAFCIQSIPDLKIIEVNDEACKRFGYSREEFKNLTVNDLTSTPTFSIDSIEMQQKMKKVFDGETQSFEWLSKAKNGKELWHLMTLKTIEIEGERILLSQAKDIEDLKKVHNELKSLNEQLEKEVEDRTEKIQQLLQQKDEFINQLGHDLKNPLGPFMHLLPILKNHITDEKDQQIVDVLDRNASYMRNLVKKTIDLAKLNSEKTQFSFEYVYLKNIINDVIIINQQFFKDNDMIINNLVNSDFQIFVDEFHIQEVFTNLFNNAVKYTDKSGAITIDAKSVDQHVLVSVKDTGRGISSDQIDHIFKEYYKADHSRHDFDSSGLGLSICKRIIQRHGGRIWAESEGLGKGSTFYFTVPKSD